MPGIEIDVFGGDSGIDLGGGGLNITNIDTDIPGGNPGDYTNLPDVPDDSTDLETYWRYFNEGVDVIGDILDIGKDLGIIDDENVRDIQDTQTGIERDLAKWFDNTFGTVISDRTISTMLPWIIGLSAAGLIIYFATRKRSA